jgi:hypothetical protein
MNNHGLTERCKRRCDGRVQRLHGRVCLRLNDIALGRGHRAGRDKADEAQEEKYEERSGLRELHGGWRSGGGRGG